MELFERKDFIQIDYKDSCFVTVCIRGTRPIPDNENEDAADFGIMQRFNENLEECIKFTIGSMSAIRLFKKAEYRPVDYIEIIFTEDAKRRIMSKKYKVAEYMYPDLKQLKGVWRLLLH